MEAYSDAQPLHGVRSNGFARLEEDPLYGR